MTDVRADLQALIDAQNEIMQAARPLREERDDIRNEAARACRILDGKIREIEKDLYAIQKEIGALSRALGGRTMSGS